MKYAEMISELRNNYTRGKISKNEIFHLYQTIYSNNNIKTFENMISLLKQYEVITDYSIEYYTIIEKSLYKMKEQDELKKISNIILKEYKNIKTIVWDTNILNEFTQHYTMNNYIVVETEREAIEMILTLLKEKLMKKYTILTENMYNQNKNMFLNNEKLLIVKALNSRAPLDKTKDGTLEPTIEKIMIDLYKDKLYEFVQGNELQKIYINILDNYNINQKRLESYAKDRMVKDQYIEFFIKLKCVGDNKEKNAIIDE